MAMRSSVANKIAFCASTSRDVSRTQQSGDSAQQSRMIRAVCSVRSPLYDVRKHASHASSRRWLRIRCSRTVHFKRQPLGHRHCANRYVIDNQTIWWSQTGSNRRPHACKARALPAELWPRNQKTNAAERTQVRWWAWEDLNFRPHAYQARALTN